MLNKDNFEKSFARSERRFFGAFIFTAILGLLGALATIAAIIYIVRLILEKV